MKIELTEDWGFRTYRFRDNPLEKRFAKKFADFHLTDAYEFYKYILTETGRLDFDLTDDVIKSVNKLIQWLGTPVGQGYLRSVLQMKNPCKRCLVQACCQREVYECDQLKLYKDIMKLRRMDENEHDESNLPILQTRID